uniref:Uncharacterized protein n=1 Tax=Arundo donax TaxID=35708 RepID=A0A0A9CDC6_ARUDO
MLSSLPLITMKAELAQPTRSFFRFFQS